MMGKRRHGTDSQLLVAEAALALILPPVTTAETAAAAEAGLDQQMVVLGHPDRGMPGQAEPHIMEAEEAVNLHQIGPYRSITKMAEKGCLARLLELLLFTGPAAEAVLEEREHQELAGQTREMGATTRGRIPPNLA